MDKDSARPGLAAAGDREPRRRGHPGAIDDLVGRLSRALLVALLVASLAALVAAAGPQDDEALKLDSALIEEALEVIADRFVDPAALTSENLTAGAIRGMVEALGDEGHTEYLTPDENAAAQDALEGRVTGIGVVLDQRSETALVISVIDGSPADRAGLRSGDVIGSVDGTETTRLPVGDLAALVRGEPGTTVRLGIDRPGLPERLEVRVVREDVEVSPADWALVPGTNVAVVRIVQFSEDAGDRSRDAVAAAIESGVGGIVLDLRGNPGGFVHEALDVVAAFLDGGVAYQEVGRDGDLREVSIPTGRSLAEDIPVIVLVDYATASSAEILAAALHDNDRAVLVGEQTFGTGTVLNTFELSDGSALKLGVLDWLSPDGESVFRVGLTPDHEVDQEPGASQLRPDELRELSAAELSTADDLPLRRAVALLEPLAVR
jgi:carboxyl-terminal processing protease